MDDYDETIVRLGRVAGSLKPCDNKKLAARGLRRINFKNHRYFFLYYLENDTAVVTNMFHELEDYENKLK